MPEIRRAVKDSVFTYLFKQPEYTRLLYLALYPEDKDVTEQDCKLITLENVISTGIYQESIMTLAFRYGISCSFWLKRKAHSQ